MLSAAIWITRRVEALAVVVLLVLAIPSSAAGSETLLSASVGSDSELLVSLLSSDRLAGENWTSSDHRRVHAASESASGDSHSELDVFHEDDCNPWCHSAVNSVSSLLDSDRSGKRIALSLCRVSSRDFDVDKAPPKSPAL